MKLERRAVLLSKKAQELYRSLAEESGVPQKLLATKLLINNARRDACGLPLEQMKDRLALIDEINEEYGWNLAKGENRRNVYRKVWDTHKRLKEKGKSKEEIHEYCLERYGYDFDIKDCPQKTPKVNPNWKGGGRWRNESEDEDGKGGDENA